MPMTTTEARELRAAISEALDPLYAARTGTLRPLDAVCRAITVIHRIDRALLAAINGEGAPARFTPEERIAVIDYAVTSQAQAGVTVTPGRAAELLREAEGRPLPRIGEEG